jgi:oligopeptide/dipeptide ABC transporter ATP-binding protein
LCHKLGLPDTESIFDKYPHELSGGMIQRAALVLTLMPSPQLIVVDEPTSALDAHLRVEALRLLKAITVEDGTSIILISHDLGMVSHFSDRVAILYSGHLVEFGATRDVIGKPSHPYTEMLLSSSLSMDKPSRTLLPIVAGEPPMPGAWPSGCYFHTRCPRAEDRCESDRPALIHHKDRKVSCHYPA